MEILAGLIFILYCLVHSNQAKKEYKYKNQILPASEGEFPHHASLQVNGSHICSGSLISLTHIITSGYCTRELMKHSNDESSILSVEVGSIKLNEGQSYPIKRLSYKNDYEFYNDDPSSLFISANNIGMVTLNIPVEESALMRPIELGPTFEPPSSNSAVVVSNFGNSLSSKFLSPSLQKTVYRVVNGEKCDKYYYHSLKRRILPSQICVKLDAGHGICQADEGAPLIQRNKLIGVFSTGNSRCSEGHPQIYTNILSFAPYIHHEWIYNISNEEVDAISPAVAKNFIFESSANLEETTDHEESTIETNFYDSQT
ncbi:hypothetical protein QAD02_000982 [Eretmocerus hayati]|uniref:Uncharacterized protein n=1 Tax=Eretmocerus hayati TaxID=131215 RepID=A0ACC2NG06_9HYME|nr:hypothetical protein QAD02_000982 [Eretmocerus hayati]